MQCSLRQQGLASLSTAGYKVHCVALQQRSLGLLVQIQRPSSCAKLRMTSGTDILYPIGVPGTAWGPAEKKEWLAQASIKRSYADEVLAKVEALRDQFDVEQYGALSIDPDRYPLFAIKSRHRDASKPTVLITGGVHGYETSGVQGALAFLQTKAQDYAQEFNIVCAPCVRYSACLLTSVQLAGVCCVVSTPTFNPFE